MISFCVVSAGPQMVTDTGKRKTCGAKSQPFRYKKWEHKNNSQKFYVWKNFEKTKKKKIRNAFFLRCQISKG